MARTGARVKMRTGGWYLWRMDRDEVVRVLRAFEEVGLEYVCSGRPDPTR